MNKSIDKVRDFDNIVGGKRISLPSEDKELTLLKIRLIREELEELEEACEKDDKIEMLDALGDLAYVLFGAAIAFKLDTKLKDAFNEIHSSNLSKFCTTEEDAIASIENYKKIDVECYYKKVKSLYVIFRKSDDKILKSIHFRKPTLKI